jgi:hypothetical protein
VHARLVRIRFFLGMMRAANIPWHDARSSQAMLRCELVRGPGCYLGMGWSAQAREWYDSDGLRAAEPS